MTKDSFSRLISSYPDGGELVLEKGRAARFYSFELGQMQTARLESRFTGVNEMKFVDSVQIMDSHGIVIGEIPLKDVRAIRRVHSVPNRIGSSYVPVTRNDWMNYPISHHV